MIGCCSLRGVLLFSEHVASTWRAHGERMASTWLCLLLFVSACCLSLSSLSLLTVVVVVVVVLSLSLLTVVLSLSLSLSCFVVRVVRVGDGLLFVYIFRDDELLIEGRSLKLAATTSLSPSRVCAYDMDYVYYYYCYYCYYYYLM